MSNQSTSPRILLIIGTLYLVFYSIFLLSNVTSAANTNSLNPIFYGLILITLAGSWGWWNQKKIFSKSFWKYFLIFQIVFYLIYFYITYNLAKGITPIFIEKILLFLPLCFIIYFYAFKNDLVWEISDEAKTTQNNIINFKNHSVFFISLILITLLYNPFPQDNLTPAEYNSLGVQAGNRGDLVAERRYYMKGLKAAKKLHQENSPDVGKIYFNLAINYDQRFNEKASGIYAIKAINIYKNLVKHKGENQNNQYSDILAESYRSAGSNDTVKPIEKRILYISEAIIIFQNIKDNRGLSISYQALADVYSDIGDYTKSKLYYEDAIKIAKNSKINDVLADNYKLYADSLFAQKKYNDAEKIVQKSIRIFKDSDKQVPNYSRQLGNAYNVLAKIYSTQGKCDESIKYYSLGVPMMNQSVKLNPVAIKLILKDFKDKCELQKVKKDN